jgi:tetratricopeptide (TPR) repeat protein
MSRAKPRLDRTPAPRLRLGWRSCALVIGAALGVRLLHVWQLHDTLFASVLMGDARGYDRWAREIAAGDWIGRDVFYQAPLYPYFLACLYAVAGHDLLIVRLLQAAIGALSAAALWYAASVLVGPRAGLIAGLMLALYPPAIFFDALIQKSVLDVGFVSLALALLARASSTGGRGAWLGLGLSLGAFSLTRENALVLAALVLLWAFTIRDRDSPSVTGTIPPARRGSRRRHSRLASPPALLAAGLVLVLVPVVARNAAVGGGFYLTTSQFGSNLFIGNNPHADGSYVALRAGRGSPEFERLDAATLAEQAVGRPLTPAEVSSYWTSRTLEYVWSQPGDWLALLARKARLLVSGTEIIDTESQDSHAEYSIVLRTLGPVWHFGVALPLAVVGAWALWTARRRLWPLYAMTAAYAVSVVAFFVVARYRLPLVPFVLVFAAAGVEAIASVAKRQESRDWRPALALAALVAVTANWPLHSADSQRAITENNLGAALQEEGRIEEAILHYRRAAAFDAGFTPALNNLGTALKAAGRLNEAIAVYERALAEDADAARVQFNLGNARMAAGDLTAAVAAFRAAVAADPRFAEAYNNFGEALAAVGDRDGAVAAFREAVRLDSRGALARGNLANLLASRGEAATAAALYREALALEPANAALRYDYGSLLLEQGAVAAAADELRESIRLAPESPAAYNNLGIALASQGRMAEAVQAWRDALRLKPDFADALRNLERAGPGRAR